ncbi:MAG: cbs domain containing protein [Cyclobacteriaceae bacterium]|nr:cbs domain containing protein [Cyclobacteriaceae bacterium HetDA_MAG_MS6]
MIAKDLINYTIPPLKPTDQIGKARLWMEELRVTELPVADKGKFLGLLSETMLLSGPWVDDDVVESIQLQFQESIVEESKHYYDVLRAAYDNQVKLVAVNDLQGSYMGVISVEDVIEAFAQSASVSTPGAILILTLDYRDYSLSEISRLVEINDAKILSSHFITDPNDPSKINLTLKINTEEISHLVNVLETNGYKVSESFNEAPASEQEQERLDILMKYLKL